MSHVFVSYVREDMPVVDRLVGDLRRLGVQLWLDREQVGPGARWRDAIRTAIASGDYFLACFSKNYLSRDKTYMNEELNLAIEELRLRARERSWFIPVLVSPCEVPDYSIIPGETLRDIQWVDLADNWEVGVNKIVATVNPQVTFEDVQRIKLQKGYYESRDSAPSSESEIPSRHKDSERLARYICEQSKNAQVGGELFDTESIRNALKIGERELGMAVDELQSEGLLRNRASNIGKGTLMAEVELFRRMDPIVKGWDPKGDALAVARELVKNIGGAKTTDIAAVLGWGPRRMNPACEELAGRNKANARKFMGSSPFTYGHLIPTDATHRLARDGW